MLAQQRLVGSTVKTIDTKSKTGHGQDFTTITQSKDLVDFQKEQLQPNKQKQPQPISPQEQRKPVAAAIPKKKR